MKHTHDEEHEQGGAYTCLLWNVRSGQPILVTIHVEHHDRWIGQRCIVTVSSFDAPIEMFMKSDWQRDEPQAAAGGLAPAPATASASQGAGALIAQRGIHPSPPAPAPPTSVPPVPARAAGGARKRYGFHP